MRYIITITTTDANGNVTTTTTTTTATDARQAHEYAATIAADGAKIRVYPDTATAAGIARGAVMIARRTALNAIMRQGTPTQHTIERETAAINARIRGAETAERILTVVNDYSHDTREFFAIAAAALSAAAANGKPIDEQYRVGYVELNAYIHSQRAATEYEISTEFLQDGGGDLVAINTAIASIIRGGDKWTPADGGEMDAATAARLGQAIADAMRIVTPTQRRIAELLARGYSQRQIADKTGRAITTIEKNIAILRGKIAGYISGAAAEFEPLIKQAATAAAAKKWSNGARTIEGAAREKANCKARHSAEYYRAYRARKAAEKGE